jgi:hypothetical protein
MPEYRICYVTPDDHIAVAPVRFVRENDHAAVQYAQSLRDRNCYQLWQGRRLVSSTTQTDAGSLSTSNEAWIDSGGPRAPILARWARAARSARCEATGLPQIVPGQTLASVATRTVRHRQC